MAERVVNRVTKLFEEDHDKEFEKSQTEDISLCGGPFKNYKEVKKYIKSLTERVTPLGLTAYDAWFLVTTYGKQAETILERFEKLKDKD